MDRLVIEQLTIFETFNTFDEGKAYWKDNSCCYISGFVPKDALSPVESDLYPGCVKKKNFHYELWEHHAYGIWSYINKTKKFDWAEAIKILEEHRDNKIPIKMKICYELKEWFIYTQVNEYLV
ncbi:hypothetical protein RJD24_18685 [Bacillaceae bacterium IKA-2]|nr:hypothetical protein RJD24_18685 [Bacillaceae bacterium IKA-2]